MEFTVSAVLLLKLVIAGMDGFFMPPPGLERMAGRASSQKYISPSKKRRDNARAYARSHYMKNMETSQYKSSGVTCKKDRVANRLAEDIRLAVSFSKSPLANLCQSMIGNINGPASGRQRDVFPLPWVQNEDWSASFVFICNCCIAALNYLASGCGSLNSSIPTKATPTKVQALVHCHVTESVERMLERFASSVSDEDLDRSSISVFADYCPTNSSPAPTLSALLVDLPVEAAVVDTEYVLPLHVQDKIKASSTIFPNGGPGFDPRVKFTSGPRSEYVLLTARSLLCGKVRLRLSVQGNGSVFPVHKKGGRQREVWHGKAVSSAASPPPKPERLGNPSVFTSLEVEPGEQLLFSKRDAAAYFDCLRAPRWLSEYLGRPQITAGELATALDKDIEWLRGYFDEDVYGIELSCDTLVHPVGATWAMGFSWSSYIAQATSLEICALADLPRDAVLSLDHEMPECLDEVCTVTTDDIVLIHKSEDQARMRLEQLDLAFEFLQVPRNQAKDVSMSTSLGALGCELQNDPPRVEPDSLKLFHAVRGGLGLVVIGHASPRQVAALVGVQQWFAQLKRPYYAIFQSVYAFQRIEPGRSQQVVPIAVCQEVLLFALLAPLLAVRLDKPWLDLICASDAAQSFGYGVSVAHCPLPLIKRAARKSTYRNDFVRLSSDPADNEKPRIGAAFRLPIGKSEFVHVLRIRAKTMKHPGQLEMEALILLVKWLSRSASRCHHRVLVLVDAKTVLGAALKGRSSSPPLLRALRIMSAVLIGCDIQMHLLYVPSENNPADAPSRGLRSRPRIRREALKNKRAPRRNRLQRYIDEIDEAMRKCRESGMISSFESSSVETDCFSLYDEYVE